MGSGNASQWCMLECKNVTVLLLQVGISLSNANPAPESVKGLARVAVQLNLLI